MANPSFSLDDYQRPALEAPGQADKILLHSCCAPCAGEVMLAVQASGIEQTVFFYNPNIHPVEEYELRKDENKRFCDKLKLPFIDADYDKDNWFEQVKGLENEPERGKRCTVCFDMRFERTALYASEHDFPVISSTLGISRWKNMEQINESGIRAASHYPEVTYWTFNWRKQGGSQRMIELAKQEVFYQQEYCGCVYSLRDTNRHRMASGRPRVKRLVKFYGNLQDDNEESVAINVIASSS
ncbi:epoxyqueuosine reductase QueH [Endozoicomonas numazuensis]|uniref:epoxyqueuosine reductase QueH n=1 Tax=Endozoicomonas numazuensis TaxID=1137799 RepID=UPI00068CEE5A|nr:epoxyqueuosine reductase QueH [Endozoicomonas numazuensis]